MRTPKVGDRIRHTLPHISLVCEGTVAKLLSAQFVYQIDERTMRACLFTEDWALISSAAGTPTQPIGETVKIYHSDGKWFANKHEATETGKPVVQDNVPYKKSDLVQWLNAHARRKED